MPRAAAVAVLVASAAIGGVSAPATLAVGSASATVAGRLVDGRDAPLVGIKLVIEELLPPDGGLAGYQVTTDGAGAFSADVEPWGTAAAPATLTIATPKDEVQTVNVIDGSCTHTFTVTVNAKRDVTLAEGPTDPFALTGTMELLGEVCGTTATPPPANGGARGPAITPPPTDVIARTGGPSDDGLRPKLIVGFAVVLGVALVFVTPRPRGRRRG